MSTLELLTFFFLFFLPHIAASKCHQSKCSKSYDAPPVRFPFWIGNHQPSRCGYSTKFNLSCNERKKTILTLPSTSGRGDFIVESIYYDSEQSLRINDQNKCLPKRFLDKDFSLEGSPFEFEFQLKNYTFFRCSPNARLLQGYVPITCLSSDNYKVVAVFAWLFSSSDPPSNCTAISTAMAPFNSYDWEYFTDFGVRLTWGVPDCRSCEASGRVCGLQKGSDSQLHCSKPHPGLSNPAKFRLVKSVGAPAGLVFLSGLAIFIFTFFRNRLHPPQPITELSLTANGEPRRVVITGLDESTIESYPSIQLGETWDFPTSDDNTCPICLCEYRPKETLRTIPECCHHFHDNCIDEWLRKNPTCPVCRKVPQDQ